MRTRNLLRSFIVLTMSLFVSNSVLSKDTSTWLIPFGEAGRASELDGAFGVDVGPDGLLYVAIALRNMIFVLNPKTGEIVRRLGLQQGVDGPDDLEVADNGTVYWTSPALGTVSMLTPDGTLRTQFVAPGLNPITIRDDGRIFVAAAFDARGLFEVDPLLLAPPRVILANVSGLNGFDFGPDGLLYSPNTNTGNVVRINVDAVNPVVENVVPEGTFKFPGAVSFDAKHVLHVAEAGLGQVLSLDIYSGQTRKLFGIRGTIDNLAFDKDNSLYVTGLSEGQVHKRLPNGFAFSFSEGGLIAPGGLAVDRRGAVLAADAFSLRRLVLGFERPLKTFNAAFAPGSLLRPLTVDSQDDIALVTSLDQGGVVQFVNTRDGRIVEARREFVLPSNAIFYNDDIAVALLLNGSVVRGDGSTILNGLLLPLGLARKGDQLFIGDFAAGKIWRTAPGATPEVLAAGLSGPEGMVVFQDWLLVAETLADRITAINLNSAESQTLLELDLGDVVPTGAPPYGILNGLAVDSVHRLLYISSDKTNQVLAFKLRLPRQ